MKRVKGTILRFFVVSRKSAKVQFNIFMIDTPEQDYELVDRCGWGTVHERDFPKMIERLGMEDVSTNIEVYDLMMERR